MVKTTLLRLALVATLSVPSCLAQTGTVIFYTPGTSAKNVAAGLLPRSQQPFTGWLFDGPQRLARVRPGRLISFHLSPGTHSFTVPWHPAQPGKEPLVISIEGGGKYCIRLYAKMTNLELFPFQWLDSQIEEVPCEQAEREAASMKPIESKWVEPTVRSELEPTTAFPGKSEAKR